MRVLLTSWGWPTHFLPLIPLGQALRAAGHDVVVAGQPGLLPTIHESGLTATIVGSDGDFGGIMRTRMGLESDIAAEGKINWSRNARGEHRGVLGMFASLAEDMVDDLITFGKSWKPDLIVYEPFTYAGPLAAAVLGVPGVRHLLGMDFTYTFHEYEPRILGGLIQRLGLEQPSTLGTLTVDPCPSQLQFERDLRPTRMRFLPSNGSGVMPSGVSSEPRRARVCVTWGTTLSKLGSHLFLVDDIVQALGELDIELVIAISAKQRDLLGEVPANARVVESTPLNLVLPSCSLMVHQGGQGTMLTGMAQGVPQLITPLVTDQWLAAKQYVATGAGRYILHEEFSPEILRKQVIEILHDSSARESASLMAQENDATPPPSEIVPVLEDLAGSGFE